MTQFAPKFLYKNKITDVSQISDSAVTTDANKSKLFDRNYEQQYYSVGAASGTRTITWTPSSVTSVNRIFVQNINWSTFTIKYNTSTAFSTAISFLGNTETNLYFEFNSVSVTNVVISVTATMTAGEVIKCGQLYVGSEIFEMSSPSGSYRIEPAVHQKIIELSDGTYFKNYIRSVSNINVGLIGVSPSERLNYKAVFNLNRLESFVFIPQPATSTDSWDGVGGHYHWGNGPDFENYTENLLVNGYDVNIQLLQAGGVG